MNLRDKRLLVMPLVFLVILPQCLGAPIIEQGPANQTVEPGDTVRFTCQVSGKTDSYLVAWFIGDQQITYGTNESLNLEHISGSRFSLSTQGGSVSYTSTLEIRGVISLDGSYPYYCGVNTNRGFQVVNSEPAMLQVHSRPDLLKFRCGAVDLDDVSALRLGQIIVIECESKLGNPPASLEWFLDSEVVDATEATSATSTSLSIVKTIGLEDNGDVYRCQLNQDLLDAPEYCEVGPLNVLYKPMDIDITGKIQSTDTSVFVPPDGNDLAIIDIGDRVNFNCGASANPEAEYNWTITEAPGCSTPTNNIPIKGTLILTSATLAYNGATVTCTASNSLGQVSMSFTISVVSTDPNALCYTPAPPTLIPTEPGTNAYVSTEPQLTTLHIVIIVIAAAFLIVIIILAYIALSRRRETPIQLHMTGGAEDARSLSEASIVFHSRHNTPLPEHRANSLGRMQSNFSTMSYDTQSIDSATALMHLKSLESPEYKANPKLTDSPTRKRGKEYGREFSKDYGMEEGCCGKECGGSGGGGYAKKGGKDDMERSPFHRVNVTENMYEGSPRRGQQPSPPLCEKSGLSRQPSEHKYEECPPLKKYTTHASQTDLTITGASLDEREEIEPFNDSEGEDDFDYNPPKQNYSVNNCNIRYVYVYGRHTEV